MTRGPRIQVVLHRDEPDAAEDLVMFARALSRKHILSWDCKVVELDTSEESETAIVTIQFDDAPSVVPE